jgi:hypothetical protein
VRIIVPLNLSPQSTVSEPVFSTKFSSGHDVSGVIVTLYGSYLGDFTKSIHRISCMVKSKNYSWLRSNNSIVTFKDLKKRVTLESQQQTRFSESQRNKPFWYWNIEEHKKEDIKSEGNCCFNHIVGLPSKERIEKPIFDYQKIFYDALLIPNNYNEGTLDKEATSYDDIFDAYRLALEFYHHKSD